ncbi:MAG: energy-coupling factor transporter ATPase [Lachnospiraceae bacterium]|nr:energy-coupling factor transporter ATPase [Lachnospiraceae bacterium]
MISAKDVSYKYEKSYETDDGLKTESVMAIKNINVDISDGEFVAFLGHNGSGKSTFAKQLNALLQPTEGVLWVNGFDTSNSELFLDIRKSCGMVFQNPSNQIVATVVEEDIAFGPENLGIPPKEIRKRVNDSLKRVGMESFLKATPSKLSGGQQQRIAIAGVLAMQPKCIVLDEPTAMLDPIGRKEVINTVLDLNKNYNITIVLITHYMNEAVEADTIYVIDDGEIVMKGKPREVFSQVEKLKGYGLDVPQITEVAHNLHNLGIDIPVGILTIEEMVDAICQLKSKT